MKPKELENTINSISKAINPNDLIGGSVERALLNLRYHQKFAAELNVIIQYVGSLYSQDKIDFAINEVGKAIKYQHDHPNADIHNRLLVSRGLPNMENLVARQIGYRFSRYT